MIRLGPSRGGQRCNLVSCCCLMLSESAESGSERTWEPSQKSEAPHHRSGRGDYATVGVPAAKSECNPGARCESLPPRPSQYLGQGRLAGAVAHGPRQCQWPVLTIVVRVAWRSIMSLLLSYRTRLMRAAVATVAPARRPLERLASLWDRWLGPYFLPAVGALLAVYWWAPSWCRSGCSTISC
jgi:hypothetical protein